MRNKEQKAEEAAITAAEIYAVRCVSDAMKRSGVIQGSPFWQAITDRTTDLLMYHREEVRGMYKKSKQLLREWVLRMTGTEQLNAEIKMQQMGLTGDIAHDMQLMQQIGGMRR